MLAAGDIITLGLGHYRLNAALASSSYGTLWGATGPRGANAVLKFVNQAQMASATPDLRHHWMAAARNEAAFLHTLAPWDQRHIVRLLDAGTHQQLPVLALESMACDLARHLDRHADGEARTLPLARLLDWLAQLNQALAKVHQYGWRHLDLKPSNVLLSAGHDTVKLADFGTARPLADHALHAYSGTAAWQAPEQFFPLAPGAYASSAASDYFALGALFYFIVTGGVSLRFGSLCAQAYRAHGCAGASVLLEGHGGKAPPTLDSSEESLFTRGFALEHMAASGSHELPVDAKAALRLLRALLAPQPDARPANALQISRMLAAIRPGRKPIRPMVQAWQAGSSGRAGVGCAEKRRA